MNPWTMLHNITGEGSSNVRTTLTCFFFFVLMGVGGIVHSMNDYNIAFFVVRSLNRGFAIPIFRKAKEEAA
ncbi:hypothetical protein [Jeotgalibaca porci]|uniref:hypothetical protein n=1 Tax=Jeotgalibaca porci TaxID=1868793 RepID=UPI0035A17434